MTHHSDIESRLAAATPGPWQLERPHVDQDGWRRGSAIAGTPGRQTIYTVHDGRGTFPAADAKLIAHAPTDLRTLLDENAKLREALGRIAAAGDRPANGVPYDWKARATAFAQTAREALEAKP